MKYYSMSGPAIHTTYDLTSILIADTLRAQTGKLYNRRHYVSHYIVNQQDINLLDDTLPVVWNTKYRLQRYR